MRRARRERPLGPDRGMLWEAVWGEELCVQEPSLPLAAGAGVQVCARRVSECSWAP